MHTPPIIKIHGNIEIPIPGSTPLPPSSLRSTGLLSIQSTDILKGTGGKTSEITVVILRTVAEERMTSMINIYM
ncbi:MAG TPA: hypothetical protein VFI70_13840 [Nitrososphaeraceae archaeon]|nr:hypothetical protein [Nitrososphaeraceae archaeon]